MTVAEALTTEELARLSGVPVRTVRFYQTKGLLPPPERVGREARYQPVHLERLQLITALQERGLRLSAIAEILANAGDAASLPAWLGLGETLARPWTDDRAELLTADEVRSRVGQRPVTIADLERAGLIERRSDTTPVTFLVPSPALFEIGLEMVDAGVDLDTSSAARDLLQRRLGRLADDLVTQITERVTATRLAEGGPGEVAAMIDRLRPMARRSVDVVFAHEMERALREAAEPPAPAPRPAVRPTGPRPLIRKTAPKRRMTR